MISATSGFAPAPICPATRLAHPGSATAVVKSAHVRWRYVGVGRRKTRLGNGGAKQDPIPLLAIPRSPAVLAARHSVSGVLPDLRQ
ncbi:hypothetical protein D3C76_1509840 [compost metagenome]